MKILITDGYKKADFLISNMCLDKHNITFIHEDKKFAEAMLEKHDIDIYIGNTSNINVFDNLDSKKFDVLIALSNLDHKNFIVSKIADHFLEVSKRIVLVSNPNNEKAFNDLNITGTVSASHLISGIINKLAVVDDALNFIGINNKGEVRPVEVKIQRNFSSIGKSIKELEFPDSCVVCCIIRNKRSIIPNGDEIIEKHDQVVIFTDVKSDEAVLRVFS